MGCTQSKGAEDSAAARHNRELQRSLEQVCGLIFCAFVAPLNPRQRDGLLAF